jgi:hypothetical protein
VQPTGLHSEALEPPTGPGDLPATEDVIDAVGEEHAAGSQPKHQ